jgi:uncharacterized protein (DUF433 family)
MKLTIRDLPMPLHEASDGRVRVGDTRVGLIRVIEGFREGLRPEEIVDDFDTLRLADVYLAIAYYLYYQKEVDAYLRACEEEAEQLRRQIEASQPPSPALERVRALKALLARLDEGRVAPGS